MRQWLVAGGWLDFVTLHPLGSLIVILAAFFLFRGLARAYGPGRRARSRRRPDRGEGEGRRPASHPI
jgi:hypothetical protein